MQWKTDGIAISTAPNSQDYPKMVSDGGDGVIITWMDERSGCTLCYDIYAQKLNADGTLGVLPGPDLTGSWKLVGPSVSTGGIVYGRLRVENSGQPVTDNFRISMYLSSDGVQLGSMLKTWKVKSMSGFPKNFNIQLPYPGQYVIAVIDSTNLIVESDETNNRIAVKVPQ